MTLCQSRSTRTAVKSDVNITTAVQGYHIRIARSTSYFEVQYKGYDVYDTLKFENCFSLLYELQQKVPAEYLLPNLAYILNHRTILAGKISRAWR